MMKIDRSKEGAVRGYVVFSQWRAGQMSLEIAKNENLVGFGVAYTPWHRTDEDPEAAEKELDMIAEFYGRFKFEGGMMLGFEYKDLRN